MVPGSHIDMIPTILDIIGSSGLSYYSFGESLFSKSEKLNENKVVYGFGNNTIITNELVYNSKISKKPQYFIKNNLTNKDTLFDGVLKKHDYWCTISHYFLFKGDELID